MKFTREHRCSEPCRSDARPASRRDASRADAVPDARGDGIRRPEVSLATRSATDAGRLDARRPDARLETLTGLNAGLDAGLATRRQDARLDTPGPHPLPSTSPITPACE